MQFLGQYRAIVVFVALSTLASAFYFTLWSSIDPENVLNGEGIASSISRTFRHQYQNKRPLPVPESELRPPVDSSDPTKNSPAPVKLGPKKLLLLQKHAYKQRKQAERVQRYAYKQQKEAEREQKARRKQRIRDAENEPFPSLITANNARVDALNLRAYNKFCVPGEEGIESNGHEGSAGGGGGREHLSVVATTGQDHDTTKKNVDFTTFEEWTQYIRNKNSGQEQTEPLPLPVFADQEEPSAIPVSTTPKLHRPLFLERPLRGWIVNMTALKGPCNRHEHTSAHCLAYLSRDHEYLMPSRQARKLPNSSTARKKLHDTPLLPMDFHIFWKGPVSDKLWMSVHAFLFTQPLDRAHLHLWIDSSDLPGGVAEDYEKNEFAKPLVAPAVAEHVQIHAWDQKALEEFAYGSQKQEDLSPSTGPATPPVALSDEARFLILYRYGGMYLDADVLLLRDMSPFYDAGREFAYEWSNTEMYNTAVLRLKQNSSVARRILDGAKARAKEVQEMQWRKEHHGEVRLEEHAEVAPPQEAPSQHQELIENDKQPRGQDLSETKVEEIQGHNTGEPMKAIPLAATTPITNAAKAIDAEDNDDIGSSEGDSLFLPTDTDAMSATQGSASIMATISSHRLVKRGEMRPKEVYHPARLRQYLRPEDSKIEGNGLNMLPVAVFDPLWLRVDDADGATEAAMRDPERMMPALTSFPDAFSSKEAICPGQSQTFVAGPEVFFAGAYAYHWHNNWKSPIEPQSWMGLMRQAYDDFTAGQRPNLYGEWFSGETDDEEY
ncbi:hypothetical protein BG006_006382 [Podila minutissima]|uniref:Glycosyltransferase family 32 protein n=1 Tax=Podila minutissima TaxID=64525 RepID=A0A9P5VQX4_9FUNG|nr:hypothetical protein BG006_006382 [Podila minutissima]